MFARFFSRKGKKQKPITRTPRRRPVPLSFEWLESRIVPSATLVDFEDLSLAPNSFQNGSNGLGGFVSRGASFNNSYDPAFGDWSGWSYTNVNYTNTALYPNYPNDPDYTYQYGAYVGSGVGGSGNYGVAFCSDPAFGGVLPTITIPNGMQVQSAMFTNTTYDALSMLNGDGFAKKFGPTDWFDLTITGEDASNHAVGTVDFFLAQNGSIVTNWQSVNLSSLAAATTLQFSLTSSDNGSFGMNTPALFAMDNLTLVPKTTTTVTANPSSVTYGNPITFTATVTAASGSTAPTAGSVDFKDTTTGKDFGNGTFVAGGGTSSTATITVAANNANLFKVSAGDAIVATYSPGNGFAGSSGNTTVVVNAGTLVDFEDLSLASNSFQNGSDGSNGFNSRGTSFNNSYDPAFGDWSGWSYTDVNYTNTALYSNYPNDPDYTYQYGAYIGTGVGGSGNYGVAFCSDPAFGGVLPTVTIPNGMQVQSAMFTNTTYDALSMLNGDGFAKKFGPSDWFDLTITGEDASNHVVGTVDFFLAQNGSIVTTWQAVNLNSLAAATTLQFSLTSSDNGSFGMNTPALFAMDNLTLVPKTTTTVTASPSSVTYGNPITFTATVTAANGSAAPTAGSVDFKDTTTGKDLGNGTFVTGTGTSSTATLTIAANNVNLFNVSAGDNIVATYTASNGFAGSSGNTTVAITGKYTISLAAGNTVTAGSPFLFTVQASDVFGNPLPAYDGPTTVAITSSTPDPLGNFPLNGTLQIPGSGFGAFLGGLNTAGTYTLTATAGLYSGTSTTITVLPASVNYLTVTAPATATTGNTINNLTVTAYDQFGNIATGYAGTVQLTSTDSAAVLGGAYTFTTGTGKDNGVHTFSVTLKSAGTQKITATDIAATKPAITGTSNSIATSGLNVTSLTPTPTGFTVTFSKAFLPSDITLYGGNSGAVADVVLTGNNGVNVIHGSLLLDPSNQSFVFKATSSYLQLKNSVAQSAIPNYTSVVLPDATYTVTLISGSGSNGFIDVLGAGLDGLGNGGHANYTTTFTTHYQANATPVLSIPDFARGPDSNTPIAVPALGAGIPITLSNAANVTDVTFSLTYNPSLLNLTGTRFGAGSDASDTAATLTLVANSGGVATFHYVDANPRSATPTSPLVLGDLSAVVPSTTGAAALGLYQVKELLQLGNITINQGGVTGAVSSNGIHVNAYLGDVNGDKVINGLDKLTADNVAQGRATGFSAFTLFDPSIVGDVAGDFSVDAGDVSTIDSYVAQLRPLQIPQTPTQLATSDPNYVNPSTISSPNAADPTLSLVSGEGSLVSGGNNSPLTTHLSLFVMIDHPDPEGSTGLTSATLALTYDPTMLSVSPVDITLGSIPGQGTGWQLLSVVDQTNGQIGIQIYSQSPITVNQAGSLVNIAFQLIGEPTGVSPRVVPSVQLVDAVTPNGQWFGTNATDSQGALILSPGADQLVFSTGAAIVSPGNSSNLGNAEMIVQINRKILTDDPAQNDFPVLAATTTLRVGFEGDDETLAINPGNISVAKDTSRIISAMAMPAGPSGIPAPVAIPQVEQVLQIANLPWLNTLLYRNSQAELTANPLALVPTVSANVATDLASLCQSLNSMIWDGSPGLDWLDASNLFLAAETETHPSMGTSKKQTIDQKPDPHSAALNSTFAELARDGDDFGALID